MSIMAPRRPPFPSAWEQSLEDQLIDARCTIAELKNRIGELEAERDEALREHTDMMWQRRRAQEEADAERQRREECEAALRDVLDPMGVLQRQAKAAGTTINGMAAIDITNKPHFIQQPARAYFSRYPIRAKPNK